MHPKGTDSMAVSGLACRKALVGTGRAVFGINGLRDKPSCLVMPLFLAFYGPFFSYARLAFPENLDSNPNYGKSIR